MKTVHRVKKPVQLRIVFLLNALMMFLPFLFYYIFTTRDISIEGLDPALMVYTGMAYILSFAILVFSILSRNLILFRTMFAINVLIAIPAGAYIGILVAVISMILSYNNKIKTFFASTGKLAF